jgi:SPOR domain
VKRIIFFLPFLVFFHAGYSQDINNLYNSNTYPTQDIFQKLKLEQDPRLVELVHLHIRRNQEGGMVQGFRVEIFFSSDLNARQKAQNIKNEFLSSYSGYNVYISWTSPDFKVRVGDFRTKNEALKLMKDIQGQFPKAFVVPDVIELPKLF